MSPKPRTVTIRGTKVPVPENLNQPLAEQLARTLTRRLERIQADSDRVDTYGFALRLSLELAHQVHVLQQADQQQSAELLRQLTQLNDTIETFLEETDQP